MSLIDLHIHSYYSDGVFSPQKIIQETKKRGYSLISITDHNVIDGLSEAEKWSKKYGLKFINGVEIYSYLPAINKNLHILGYNFNPKDKNLNNILKKLQERHLIEVNECVERLKDMKFIIHLEDVFNTPSKHIGLGHLTYCLTKHPQNRKRIRHDLKLKIGEEISFNKLLQKYFFKDNEILLPETSISIQKAIRVIKKAGGLAVLAHPGQQLSWKNDEKIIAKLKKMGLDGIEAISSHHNWDNIHHYQYLAKKFKLLITAGSDFHGQAEWHYPIRSQWDYFKIEKKLLNLYYDEHSFCHR